MARKRLLNDKIISRFANFSANFPFCTLSYSDIVEESVMLECFGFDMYNDMLDKLADYKGTAKWISGTLYAIGDKVVLDGLVYICILETNIATPPNTLNWELAPLFNKLLDKDRCYENLFCNYLGTFLSLRMANTHLGMGANQITGSGNLSYHSQSYEQSTKAEIERQAHALDQLQAQSFSNMDAFIKRNETCYKLYKAFQDCCNVCKLKTCNGGCEENIISMQRDNHFC